MNLYVILVVLFQWGIVYGGGVHVNELLDAFDQFQSQPDHPKKLIVHVSEGKGLASKLMAFASGILYGSLTQRQVKLDFYESLSLVLDLSTSYHNNLDPSIRLSERNENNTLKQLHCLMDPINEPVVHLDMATNEFFIASALSLNPTYRDKLKSFKVFPRIAQRYFRPHPNVEVIYHKRLEMLNSYFKEASKLTGIVIDPTNANNNNQHHYHFYHDVHLLHQCLLNNGNSLYNQSTVVNPNLNDIVHVISWSSRYNHWLQELNNNLLFVTNPTDERQLLAEILLQVHHAHSLLLYSDSPLSQLILSWSQVRTYKQEEEEEDEERGVGIEEKDNQQKVMEAKFLHTLNLGNCYAINSNATEPCYSQSLKQLYSTCPQLIAKSEPELVGFNPHDILAYPPHLDSCKDMRRGIQVIQ